MIEIAATIRLGIIAGVFATAVSAAARSETLTLACKLDRHVETVPPDASNKYFRVDQIFIDTEKPAFELRIANTIGTAHEEVYSYVDLGDPCRKPQIQVRGDTISGSQQCVAPTGFFYSKGLHQFMLSQLYKGGGEILVWNCLE